MGFDERARAEWVCRQLETELARIGGDESLQRARTDARLAAALRCHWDGRGDEPIVRAHARLEALIRHLDDLHRHP